MDKELLQVSFLSHDSGLGEAIARALGDGFSLRTNGTTRIDHLQELLSWSDVLLLDLRHSPDKAEETGMRLLDDINAQPCHPPVLVLCDAENRPLMLRTIEKGATDSIPNPPNILELRLLFRRAYRMSAAERELRHLNALQTSGRRLHGLLGSSPAMQELFLMAERIAPCDVNVLITGETGTGKELLARAIHHGGSRGNGPLVAFSCANLPETLVEDELFGHEKGAFTGAFLARQGRVEAANHGTLFLDEIGDMPLAMQAKLLRVLEESEVERVGGDKPIKVNVRVLVATHRHLEELVKQNAFRSDLFHRVYVFPLAVAPLRERPEDFPELVAHFARQLAAQNGWKEKGFTPEAIAELRTYAWPGNLRELRNVVERLVLLASEPTIGAADVRLALPSAASRTGGGSLRAATGAGTLAERTEAFEREVLLAEIRTHNFHMTNVARALGLERSHLYKKCQQLGIDLQTLRKPD